MHRFIFLKIVFLFEIVYFGNFKKLYFSKQISERCKVTNFR